jgi:hypothetical protein
LFQPFMNSSEELEWVHKAGKLACPTLVMLC